MKNSNDQLDACTLRMLSPFFIVHYVDMNRYIYIYIDVPLFLCFKLLSSRKDALNFYSVDRVDTITIKKSIPHCNAACSIFGNNDSGRRFEQCERLYEMPEIVMRYGVAKVPNLHLRYPEYITLFHKS